MSKDGYQNSVQYKSSFPSQQSHQISHATKSAFDLTVTSRHKKKNFKKKSTKSVVSADKLYSASGQAPAPSKDFYELVVYEELLIFRKWKIRFAKSGKVVPSEEKISAEKFLESDVIQNDIERNLGDDVLNMAIGHLTRVWLPRLPTHILSLLTSYLSLKEIGGLHQVSMTFNKRLQNQQIWKNRLLQDFHIILDNKLIGEKNIRSFKKFYREQILQQREAEIDWDNV